KPWTRASRSIPSSTSPGSPPSSRCWARPGPCGPDHEGLGCPPDGSLFLGLQRGALLPALHALLLVGGRPPRRMRRGPGLPLLPLSPAPGRGRGPGLGALLPPLRGGRRALLGARAHLPRLLRGVQAPGLARAPGRRRLLRPLLDPLRQART